MELYQIKLWKCTWAPLSEKTRLESQMQEGQSRGLLLGKPRDSAPEKEWFVKRSPGYPIPLCGGEREVEPQKGVNSGRPPVPGSSG